MLASVSKKRQSLSLRHPPHQYFTSIMTLLKNVIGKFRIKKLQTIYVLYWILLTYIIAALVFWFIALNNQVTELASYRLHLIDKNDKNVEVLYQKVAEYRQRKTTQYLAEGITFLLLIIAGAIFVFRAIRRQFYQSQQQQNFMMAITHELKTPIAVTKLNLETLLKRTLQPEQQQKLISTTIQEADRLNALCNNLLLTSQMEAGGYHIIKEVIPFTSLVAACIKDFTQRYPQRQLMLEDGEEVSVNGDNMLLYLVVNNLLDNAIKYSAKEDIVLIKVMQERSIVTLQVADEGIGIDEMQRKKVFEKYYRGARRQTKGTGLGLYLTKKIVEQHGGSINIQPNNPRGTIFTVQFPSAGK